MNRRHAVKSIAIASGTLISLPAWMGCNSSDTPATHLSSFNSSEQRMLASVVDTIIPAGNSIGALSVGIDKYLQKFIDQCCPKETQDNIKIQLKALSVSAKNSYNKEFSTCTQSQRVELLNKLSLSTAKPEKEFFDLVKSETINGFTTSQQVMVNYFHYKVAPGHYYGCVDVKK